MRTYPLANRIPREQLKALIRKTYPLANRIPREQLNALIRKTYPLANRIPREQLNALIRKVHGPSPTLGTEATIGPTTYIRAVKTGEKRTPRQGEWYLSGAIPNAYIAHNDLTIVYHILRLVIVEEHRVMKIVTGETDAH